MKVVKPDYNSSKSKKEQVEEMFDNVASRYDFLNRFLSLRIDTIWRKKAIAHLKSIQPQIVLDVATGTADLALEINKQLNPVKIIGLDLSEQMLAVGRIKVAKANLSNKIEMVKGDSENLIFDSNYFDAVTVSFGVRNFENLDKGLTEINRVLKTEGKLVVLEFSNPKTFPIKQIFGFYFKFILPTISRLVNKKSGNAYKYLPESVKYFPEGEEFAKHLRNCGFNNIIVQPLTFGTCTIYIAQK
ncbi:MAG: bifunctional demethylmenaquinone methyltransferase/2-methoxy-6-polyprenyl-1,4-benzoquinol methylase UbiE [Bacteroidia bacterium]